MKITPRQAAARRANTKLSTGPKTAEGKTASSQNALKFGFFALQPLLPGESEAEFAAYRAGWAKSLRPVDHAERALVDRITDSAWRLRCFPAVEAALYSAGFLGEQAGLTQRQAQALLRHRLETDPSEAKDPQLYRQLKARESEIREELNARNTPWAAPFAETREAAADSRVWRAVRRSWNAASTVVSRSYGNCRPAAAVQNKRDKTNLPMTAGQPKWGRRNWRLFRLAFLSLNMDEQDGQDKRGPALVASCPSCPSMLIASEAPTGGDPSGSAAGLVNSLSKESQRSLTNRCGPGQNVVTLHVTRRFGQGHGSRTGRPQVPMEETANVIRFAGAVVR